MNVESFELLSNMDQLPLSTLICTPDTDPIAIFQLSHGMSEHKERYIPFIKYLCALGYICIIHDHRGHGKSVKSSQDLGFFYEHGAEAVVEDLHQMSLYIKKRYPQLPLFLFGHSMGSLIARVYLKKYDAIIDGLILSGSPSENPASKVTVHFAAMLSKIYGGHAKGKLFHRLAFGAFNRNYTNPSSPYEWICSNKEVVKEYDESPLCGFVFTLNGFHCLFSLLNQVYSKKNWKVTKQNLPIWFISGEDDPCMINQAKFKQAVTRLACVGYQNVTYQLYPDMRHEILNETNKELVYQDIATQLKLRCN